MKRLGLGLVLLVLASLLPGCSENKLEEGTAVPPANKPSLIVFYTDN